MKKYLQIIIINIIIILVGVSLSFNNVKIDTAQLDYNCYESIINDFSSQDYTKDEIKMNHKICLDNYLINDDVINDLDSINSYDDIIITHTDNILMIETTMGDTTYLNYKYGGNHIPYDFICILLVILVNTAFFIFNKNYDLKFKLNNMLNAGGSFLVIGAMILHKVAFTIPSYYYLSGIYILILLIHFYYLWSTKTVTYTLKIDELEAESLYNQLSSLKVDLKLFRRVNFSGNYYMVHIGMSEKDGFERLMGELLEKNRRLYFYINLGLLLIINIGALIYLLQYFLQ
jgi:hypothetical protein